ncbi:tetratricopeptide repeat protein [Planctomonas psychrotolerans]|uniref:tetratricopeptide repeat protein n=1 Tax=Planctomonas psychrotolerans TaxID=2528712 RepID=UPI00123BE22D|nr:tetratricopeptide repeat protein [Planctomonas psychrotolerans]
MSSIPPSIANLRGAVDLSSLVNRPAPSAGAPAAGGAPGPGSAGGGVGGAGAAIEVPSLVLDGSDANFSQVLDLSSTLPLIVVLWSDRAPASTQLSAELAMIVIAYAGRLLLVRVNVDDSPQLAAAFQAQAVPTVAAIVGGRPVPLFTGTLPEVEVRDVLDQVLELSAQNGISGTAVVTGAPEGADAEPVEEPMPPLHAEAYDAIERGDFEAAARAYRTAIAQDPRDSMAVAGLAQVSLLSRLDGASADDIRAAAAADPTDVDAQLLVADLDVSGGHVDDAFDRLLSLFATLDAAGKNTVRTRIVELFEVVGSTDERVVAARRRLAALLY